MVNTESESPRKSAEQERSNFFAEQEKLAKTLTPADIDGISLDALKDALTEVVEEKGYRINQVSAWWNVFIKIFITLKIDKVGEAAGNTVRVLNGQATYSIIQLSLHEMEKRISHKQGLQRVDGVNERVADIFFSSIVRAVQNRKKNQVTTRK